MRYVVRLAVLSSLGCLMAGLPGSANASGFWRATGNLVTPQATHTSTVLSDGRVLVVGADSAQLYDPVTGGWQAAGQPSTLRGYHAATLLPNGTVLVTGGGGYFDGTSSADIYDPATGAWHPAASMAVARTRHTATLLPDGKVLVAGGCCDAAEASQTSLSSAEVYDPATGAWHMVGSMSVRRAYHTATLLANGTVLAAGGFWYRTGTGATAEVYDPTTESWHNVPPMSSTRGGHTATRLANGRVLVTGGSQGGCCNGRMDAEIYDPLTGSWSMTDSMAWGRKFHTATLLPNGQVLVAGGYSCCSTPEPTRSSTELYDPATGLWSSGGNMNSPRQAFAASLLADGRVLVTGGYFGTNSGATPSADVYVTTYALAVGVTGSGEVVGAAPGSYALGSVVTLTAYVGMGQEFRGWTVDGVATNANPLKLTMGADHAVVAHFEAMPGGE